MNQTENVEYLFIETIKNGNPFNYVCRSKHHTDPKKRDEHVEKLIAMMDAVSNDDKPVKSSIISYRSISEIAYDLFSLINSN